MQCMKWGTEIKENRVFCDACLVIMEKYPVKPGIHIQLPQRPVSTAGKPVSRKRILSQDEQIQRLRRNIKRLCLALVCCILALGLTVSMLVHTVAEQKANASIGKNYNTVGESNP